MNRKLIIIIIVVVLLLSSCGERAVYRYEVTTKEGAVFFVDAYTCHSYPKLSSKTMEVTCQLPEFDGVSKTSTYSNVITLKNLGKL